MPPRTVGHLVLDSLMVVTTLGQANWGEDWVVPRGEGRFLLLREVQSERGPEWHLEIYDAGGSLVLEARVADPGETRTILTSLQVQGALGPPQVSAAGGADLLGRLGAMPWPPPLV